MKKVLIGLLTLGSISVFGATDYSELGINGRDTKYVKCEVNSYDTCPAAAWKCKRYSITVYELRGRQLWSSTFVKGLSQRKAYDLLADLTMSNQCP